MCYALWLTLGDNNNNICTGSVIFMILPFKNTHTPKKTLCGTGQQDGTACLCACMAGMVHTIFLDLVRHRVLTHVGETWCSKNDYYDCYGSVKHHLAALSPLRTRPRRGCDFLAMGLSWPSKVQSTRPRTTPRSRVSDWSSCSCPSFPAGFCSCRHWHCGIVVLDTGALNSD